MTRFDADTEADRIDLVADAIAAHRERDSAFCTLEADEDPSGDPEFLPPWVQFADGTLNLDCTDDELDALSDVVSRFGAFTIVERETIPAEMADEDPGTNVRVEAQTDDDRVAQFVEAAFRDAYGLSEDFRLWAVEI
ncbi:hypothetical protein [Halobacterium litoreum]|uniref:DUF7975 domain-containing protein n=1 Tax=Halobacterium litoreum TaxID=2039234 RepID=A0ABD5NDF0_9EURY|nr:hypothetical protein [Halobacterium litoreum]UHH13961.1 hypothetical protein LT972_02930 [Halobacterium litoreum]